MSKTDSKDWFCPKKTYVCVWNWKISCIMINSNKVYSNKVNLKFYCLEACKNYFKYFFVKKPKKFFENGIIKLLKKLQIINQISAYTLFNKVIMIHKNIIVSFR